MINSRRHFLATAAMTIAAARLGTFGPLRAANVEEAGTVQANQRAPRELAAIGNAAEWLNSPRLTASSLAGKVVLVDFWTYTCINWLRTLPYVRAWAQKYREELVLIGVHTPEFAFEHNIDNVRRAVRQLRIEYPVVIDNDYAIWRAFRNQYWPALYFIDARGRVRQHQFGEGEYSRSEKTIQQFLAEASVGGRRDGGLVSVEAIGVEAAADWNNLQSPETYVGSDRSRTSPRGGVPTWIGVASMPLRRVWRSISGLWLANGRSGGRPPSSAVLTGGSCIAFMRATFTSLWGRHGANRRYVFGCRSTGSHQEVVMDWMLTRPATVR